MARATAWRLRCVGGEGEANSQLSFSTPYFFFDIALSLLDEGAKLPLPSPAHALPTACPGSPARVHALARAPRDAHTDARTYGQTDARTHGHTDTRTG